MPKKPTYEELEKQVDTLNETKAALKKTTAALRDSEEKYRKTFESITDSITITRLADGLYRYVNDGFCQKTGYSREEVLGKTPFDINLYTYPEERDQFIKVLQRDGKAEDVEVSFRRKNGEIFYSQFSAKPISYEGENCLLAQARDITSRRQAEEALRESEERYRNLVEESFDGIFIQKGSTIIFTNKRLNEMLGYENEELIGQDHWVIYHPDFQDLTRERANARLRGDGALSRYEVKLKRKDGSSFYGEINARQITFPSCQERGVQVWVKDIDERKRAEKELKDSEAFLQTLLHAIPTPVFYKDREGKYLGFNQAFQTFFGEPRESLIGKTVFDINPPELAKIYYTKDEELFNSGKIQRYESQWRNAGGELRDFIFNKAIFTDSKGTVSGLIGVLIDITERKQADEEKRKLERQLHQAQKMESIGTLAGGIAHDFNNLLMAIQGRTSLMLTDREDSHPDFEHLKGIESCVGSAADLTRQLLGFARGGKYEVKPTDLNELVKKETRMFGRTTKEITLREEYEENLWSVEIDRGQIQQVLLNLYINAWQAMPAGGDLHIKTQNVMLDENHMKPYRLAPGPYVQISVTDSGIGMDRATSERIFDPFFTTKEMGRGTGLGLASAYGILQNHNGFINVYSEKGEGTIFNLYLPASDKEVVEEQSTADDLMRGSETILFVDDEVVITEFAQELLGLLGYKVLIARSGKEAISIYEQNLGKIDIVLLDMIMPDMGGGDTYDKLKALNPNVKALLSSGYSIDGQAATILDRGCNGFIQKPFRMKVLSQKLREILDDQ